MKVNIRTQLMRGAAFTIAIFVVGCGETSSYTSNETPSTPSRNQSSVPAPAMNGTQNMPPMNHSSMPAADMGHVGLDGKCPVAYHNIEKAVPGNQQFSVDYKGKTYYCLNSEARDAFLKNPEKYLPAMNGDCPVGRISKHENNPGDPKIFSIFKDKLYLFGDEQMKATFDADPGKYVVESGPAIQ